MLRLLGLGLLASPVLLGCHGPTRHTYHVSEDQLRRMAEVAHIAPCPRGPTIVVGLKRAHGGGVLVIECPVREQP
jgi:hypothetical protein